MLVRCIIFGLLALVATPGWVAAQVPESGVSRSLAQARAARVSKISYGLSFRLLPHTQTVSGNEFLAFDDSGSGDLPIDFRDGSISSVSLNGQKIQVPEVNGHLTLPAASLIKGRNEAVIRFFANVAPAGKAITRYEDKDDGKEYLYTLFVPMDADMAFPCFDQPDLKARFTLTVYTPPDWIVIANTGLAPRPAVASNGNFAGEHHFLQTEPISTYLFAFAAGPFERIAGKSGEPALYVRASQLKRAQAEAPAVQQITSRGVAWLSDYFAQPFPFPKYDLVLIPGFPFGGMEHAGATFLNEDAVLFRSAPTQADYFKRDILVLHETTHQWFGDLVTMRWFDDLWLKEGFAQYMAYKAEDALKPDSQAWKHFNEDIKPLAYGIDETQGTTPIFQQIPNLKDAKSAYGAIVYQKAPAILKQLDYRLGNTTFRDGLRLYLKQHTYANAQWADLIHAFTEAGGKDVQTWADGWVLQRGMPEITAEVKCTDEKLASLTLHQRDVLGTARTWPISNEVIIEAGGSRSKQRVDWTGASQVVAVPKQIACPSLVFANGEDQAYGRFLLDPASESFLATKLKQPGGGPLQHGPDLLRSQLWTALWEDVRVAHTPATAYVDDALLALPSVADESLSRIQGARTAQSLHSYLGAESRKMLLPHAEAVITDRMLHAPTPGLRIVNFRTFTSIAETPSALSTMKALLDGSVVIPDMPLQLQDRWNLVAHLIAMADPDAEEVFGGERARDRSGEALRYAFAAEAGTPDLRVKARYFDEYLHSADRPEDWLTQSLRPFNSWNQSRLTAPYLCRALDALPEIKLHRKIFFLGAWLGAFVDGQNSPEAQAIVHAWLARKDVDPDLRLKVLQVSDELDRTVMIRKRWPE